MTDAPAATGHDGGPPDLDDIPAEPSPMRRLLAAIRRLRDLLQPPQIWAEDRPCLAKVHGYARRGDWGPDQGLARTLGVAYGLLVALPVTTAAYLAAWLFERPSRLAATALLAVMVAFAARIP